MSWLLRSRLASSLLAPITLRSWLSATLRQQLPPALPLLLAPAGAPAAAPASGAAPPSLTDVLLDPLMRMAVPKKKVSYTRKRIKIAGFQAIRGPKLQTHMYMCPVCERMRAPHRVCGREDCATYFKHKWF